MRYLALVACAGIPLAAQVAPPVPGLDEPMRGAVHVIDPATRPPCQVWTSLKQVARHAQVRMGFEHTLDCHLAAWTRQPYARPALRLDGLTPRQAFDRLLAHRADYQWRMIDGVAVFRPRAGWVTAITRPFSGHWETGYQTGSGQHRVHIRLLMLDYDGGMVSAISGPFDAAAPWSP